MNQDVKQPMSQDMRQKIEDAGIIAVIIIEELRHALPLANSLLEGGINTIELTLRTPVALQAAQLIKKEFPDINLGMGTVLFIDQVQLVVDAGADFAVSPGCTPKIITQAMDKGLPFAPGVMTPTDIESAISLGCETLKFFPAETTGGLKHLKSMAAPYRHLGLKFIPLGGVNINNAAVYLESDLISAIGGSWVAKKELIKEEKWDTITQNAKEIKSLIRAIRE